MKLFDKYLITSHHLRVYKSSKVLRVNRLNNARSTRWITYPLNNVNIAFTFHFFVCTGNIWQSTFRGRRVSSLFCCVTPPTPRKFLPMESGIYEIFPCGMENPALWNPESRIPLTIGIQNPSSTDKDWNSVRRIRNPRQGIQNPS